RTDDFLHPPTWLVRRELFAKAGGVDESKAGMEHYDVALRIAALTPWVFLAGGPVARGRYSQHGLWYSTIVDGTNERQLPQIVEAALQGLPATPEADRVRRQARAAVCASIAQQRWWSRGGLTPTRDYLLGALQTAPGLLDEAAVVHWLKRVASTVAEASEHPVTAVKAFWEDILRATGGGPAWSVLRRRQLLGDLLEAAAYRLRRGSPRIAPFVALSAVLQDPSCWLRPRRPRRLYDAFVAPSTTAGRSRPTSVTES
ncbi:MAG TPA: hypothetical protein VM842_01485, partial [Nitrospira sp.]|nr:hypothetical protein [Nitrospira sp.]